MIDIASVYAAAQAYKDEPWDCPPGIAEMVSGRFRKMMGREITSAELKTALDGIGWTTRMAFEHGLDYGELMDAAHDLEVATRRNLNRVENLREVDQLSLGVGAGFFTGLLLGLRIRE